MNPTQAPEANEVADMYGPTSAEEAANKAVRQMDAFLTQDATGGRKRRFDLDRRYRAPRQ